MSKPIRAVISDLDGVVWRGEAAIPSSVVALRRWFERGVPLAFATNNSAHSAAEFARVLNGFGIPVAPSHVITPIEALTAWLQTNRPGANCYVIGGDALRTSVIAAGGHVVEDAGAEVVVLGTDYDLGYTKLRIATNALLNGAVLLATNPDVLSPVEDGFEPCVGALVALFDAAVPGLEPVILGKPQPGLLLAALDLLGADPGDTIMIGDQVSTDMKAAAAAGVRGIRITTNPHYRPCPGDPPHGVIDCLSELSPG
ncbi:acid sugar phosphatase [Salipiger pallidus]|uniref:Acid sugar phosphatase n=1 Tax=Salipiger pallidus TaxID=1775170 RepID=A0A8J3EHV7_9RHOB|nr:HAD-IIA family hydrolase [Salipiger pallidus]GGG85541.1 acid sugar phosphatase [Salipiger pallidus]